MSFGDDPLRMLRAARFVAQLDVSAAPRVVGRDRGDARAPADRLAPSGSPMSSRSCSSAITPRRGSSCSWRPGSPRVPARARRARARAGSRAPPQGRAPPHVRGRRAIRARRRCCGSPRCCTTSASRRRARSRPRACSSTTTRSSARGWPTRACTRCATRTPVIDDVRTLVEMHLRFHGYGDGWSDAAVRRYVRDAGPLLDELNQLTRADVHDAQRTPRARSSRRCRTISRSGSRGSPSRRTSTRCARRSTGSR